MATHSIRRLPTLLTVSLLSVALLIPMTASSVSAAPTDCRIRNVGTGTVHTSLQKAIRAARHGHKLTIKGICKGTARTGKSLTFVGINTPASGRATLDGAGVGPVLRIKAGLIVRIKNLRIRNGVGDGGGIWNKGKLVLRGRTIVTGNDAVTGHGGGIYNEYGLLKVLDRSKIVRNDAPQGGGIYNNYGTVVLGGSSSVVGNKAAYYGGGIRNNAGTFVMRGSSSVHHNTALGLGGGGLAYFGDNLIGVVCGGNIHDNTPDDCYAV
jgi:hypothetical protein